MENDPKIHPSFSISAEEVKKQEKEMMAYDSECYSNCYILLCNSAGDLSAALKCVQSDSRSKGKARGRGM